MAPQGGTGESSLFQRELAYIKNICRNKRRPFSLSDWKSYAFSSKQSISLQCSKDSLFLITQCNTPYIQAGKACLPCRRSIKLVNVTPLRQRLDYLHIMSPGAATDRHHVVMTSSRPHGGELAQFPPDGRRSLRPPDGNQRGVVGRGAGKETEGGEGAIGDEQSVPGDDEATHVLVEIRVHVGAGRVTALLPPYVHGAPWYRDVVGALSKNTVGQKLDFRNGCAIPVSISVILFAS